MRWSLKLGKIAGVKLAVHWTFLILLIWISILYYRMENDLQQAGMGVLLILLLFVCVTLHELGHAMAAKRYRILTKSITLLPIGGVAQMEKMPEKPAQELWVALAGPMVNVGIAFLLYVFLASKEAIPKEFNQESLSIDGSGFWVNLLFANVALAVFNLIPAFPMDGGRVLRALLSYRFERRKATKIAAGIGQFLAILFIFFGFFYNFWLIFIGLFIYLGAEAEANFETNKSILSGYFVRDVLMKQFSSFHPMDSLELVVEQLLNGQEQEFIIVDGGEVVGTLSRRDLIIGLSSHGKNAAVSQAMRTSFLTLNESMPLNDVYFKLLSGNTSVAAVLKNGKLIGVVNQDNINEFIMIETALKKGGKDD